MTLKEIHIHNACRDPVLLMTDLTTGQGLSCNPWSTSPCIRISPGETFKAGVSENEVLSKDMLEHGRFDLTWDESATLGWNLGRYENTTFAQGVELQGKGLSINFDNQLGYFLPIGFTYLGKDGKDLQCSSGVCDFSLDACPKDAFRVHYRDHLTGRASHEYCVSPDRFQACISDGVPNPEKGMCSWTDRNGKDHLGTANISNLLTDSDGTYGKGFCHNRDDLGHTVVAVNFYRSHNLSSIEDEENIPVDFRVPSAGAKNFQAAVVTACGQGHGRVVSGSFEDAGVEFLPLDEQGRFTSPESKDKNLHAITYECDGVHRFTTEQWARNSPGIPPQTPVDMAPYVGGKCMSDDAHTLRITTCPAQGSPRAVAPVSPQAPPACPASVREFCGPTNQGEPDGYVFRNVLDPQDLPQCGISREKLFHGDPRSGGAREGPYEFCSFETDAPSPPPPPPPPPPKGAHCNVQDFIGACAPETWGCFNPDKKDWIQCTGSQELSHCTFSGWKPCLSV